VRVARGSVVLNGTPLIEGDGTRLRFKRTLMFSNGRDPEVLDLARTKYRIGRPEP
jgi:quercetin 2,3-dioxygenase